VVDGQPFPPGGLGGGEQLAGLQGVLAVDGEILGGGLEVRADQAGVGVQTVLLRLAVAVAAEQGVRGPGEPVLDSFCVRGRCAGVEAEQLAVAAGQVSPSLT
jgi:hypothetical protein